MTQKTIDTLARKGAQPTPMRMLALEQFLLYTRALRGDLASLQSLKADIRQRLHTFGVDHVAIEMEAAGEIVEKCV